MNAPSVLSFFWKHIKPYKWYYAFMLLAPLVGSFYPFVSNYSIKLFLDLMTQKSTLTFEDLLFPVSLFLGARFALEFFWRASQIAEWKAEPYVRRSILLDSYNYVQHLPYTFFQDNFTGSISSKLKGLLDGYDKFWAEMHHGLLQIVLKVVVNLFALAMVNVYLGVFLLLWCVISMPIMYVMSMRLNQLIFDRSESKHALIGQISDKIMNIISLISFATRQKEYKKLDHQIATDFIPKEIRAYRYDFKLTVVIAVFYLIIFCFILFYMIYLKQNKEISVGDFAFVFGLLLVVLDDIWQATASLQDFSRAMGDCKSALSILSEPQTQPDRPHAKRLIIKTPSIEFHDMCFGYRSDHLVFNKLNLKIKSGEKIGLVGYSGAGKSTLVNLLLRYFDVQAGEIIIDQQSIADVTQDSLRRSIAIIPQDTMLFHRSLMENIRYGNLEATDVEVIEAAKKAHIHDYIETLPDGYQTYVGERGVKLSGGQRQRIAIARAILKDAPILILDEATSSLDSETEKSIQDCLNFLIKNKKKTVIAIAHRLSTLKHMDRILVLDHGAIIEEGTHEELLSKTDSLYKKLWEHQEI